MKEGVSYKICRSRTDSFFAAHINELINTQLFCDYTMEVLEELTYGEGEAKSYIYLLNIISEAKNKKNFAFCYVRIVEGFPIVERFFIEEDAKAIDDFFEEMHANDAIKIARQLLLGQREI